jgi:hypothetical protein
LVHAGEQCWLQYEQYDIPNIRGPKYDCDIRLLILYSAI